MYPCMAIELAILISGIELGHTQQGLDGQVFQQVIDARTWFGKDIQAIESIFQVKLAGHIKMWCVLHTLGEALADGLTHPAKRDLLGIVDMRSSGLNWLSTKGLSGFLTMRNR